jgi:toxin ParE1/3/4
MRARWSAAARRQLDRQATYIAADSPDAARLVVSRVRAAVRRLAAYPQQGRPGQVVDTRELVVPRTSLTVAYRVRGQVVEIIAVVHQSQQWPESFDEEEP